MSQCSQGETRNVIVLAGQTSLEVSRRPLCSCSSSHAWPRQK
jgi:hypothetical protein